MTLVTSDGATLRAFCEAVLRAGRETIEEVVPVVFAVAGGVLSTADPGTAALDETGDSPVLWARIDGRPFAFTYNPMTAMIELRADSLEGHPDRRFGRRSLDMDIVNFFGPHHVARATRNRI